MSFSKKFCGKSPFKTGGFSGQVLPEVKLTDKYPSKKARRKGEERKLKQELHKNPVIKAVHSDTGKAADVIKKIATTGSLFYSGLSAARALKGAGKFNLSKVKDSIVNKIKKTINGFFEKTKPI